MNKKYIIVLSFLASLCLPTTAQESNEERTDKFAGQTIDVGAERLLTPEETTGSVSIITSETTDRRSAKNIGNSIIGQGNGLISLQSGGRYADENPTFYIRGLQTLNGKNAPLVMVDGIQRDITSIAPEEVERVIVLKDAAAVAIYGYKGINGAINIVTKRGSYNTRSVKVSYDHLFTSLANKPKFVDAYTYGLAINEARANDGLTLRYSENELNALRNGNMPYLYPNVNWVDETFRDNAMTDKYNIEFRGGGQKFRYYTMIDLISNKGFVKEPNQNEGYSTQDKYVKGNLRMNMDIDLTETTDLRVNLLGVLQETSRPGSQANLWDMVYTVPSAAFPVRDAEGVWGGSDTWAGTMNPVAQSIGAAYYKNHTRSLFADMKLTQDLSGLTKGLGAFIRIGYDNIANIYENHSKEYVYSVNAPTWADGAAEPTVKSATYGKDSEMGTDAKTNTFDRLLHFDVGLNYQRTFGEHSIYSQLKWNYESNDPNGINNTVNRQNITWWSHYGYLDRYFVDLALVESASSRLAPGTKWAFSPTLSAAWAISKEKFMEDVKWIDLLKLRASAGIVQVDNLPGDEVWSYYAQQYGTSGGTYPFDSGWNSEFGRTYLGRMATAHPTREKAYKYNVGLDAKLWGSLDVTLDLWKEHRADIWVTSEGKYSAVIGMETPYENAGVVDSKGVEVALDYNKKLGQVNFNIGGNFSWNKNKIKEMLEEPRQYANLVQTGNPYGQIYGLEAIGFFKDEADIAASPMQTFSTVRPGDIKYRDVNGDNIIDANDKVAIGYSTTCPEIYYSLHLGAEWKGLGLYAMFQGTGNYSAVLNTKSMYWPLIDNTNISQYAYDNRWTPQNQHAKFPRLSSQSNKNNYQTSTLWLADRSFLKLRNLEVYYKLPASWLKKTNVVNAAKVYVRGIDLFCFDHIDENDPEAYGVNQMTKSVALGLSVTF